MEKTKWESGEIPIKKGAFELADSPTGRPKLFGARCRMCGETLFPGGQLYCPMKCSQEPTMEKVVLPPRGKLRSFTRVEQGFPGFQVPYILGIVEIEEGPWIICHIVDSDYDKLRIDMNVEATTALILTNLKGEKVIGYAFKAAA